MPPDPGVHLRVGLIVADGRLQTLAARALQVPIPPAVEAEGRGEGLLGGVGGGCQGGVGGGLPHGGGGRGGLHELGGVGVVGQHVRVCVRGVHGGREEVLAALLPVPSRAARGEHGRELHADGFALACDTAWVSAALACFRDLFLVGLLVLIVLMVYY